MSRRPTRSSIEPETRRVAIYTRKSTTMGLEQEVCPRPSTPGDAAPIVRRSDA
jgi:hypothetical protein